MATTTRTARERLIAWVRPSDPTDLLALADNIALEERVAIAMLGHKLAEDLGIDASEVRLFATLAARDKAANF